MHRKLNVSQRRSLQGCINCVGSLLQSEAERIHKTGQAEPINQDMFRVVFAYIATIANIVDDKSGWVLWFLCTCDAGRAPQTASNKAGDQLEVKTIDDLIQVLDWEA